MRVDGRGRLEPAHGLPMLRPDAQSFEEMLNGWRRQQLSRNLTVSTIEGRERLVRRFVDACGEYPWAWTVQHVDEFFADRRAVHQNRRSTIRNYQNALQGFSDYVCDPGYGWADRCLELFGTHPSRVLHHWNTAHHAQEAEHGGRVRPFTRTELQAFFDRADDEAEVIARRGRKGWAAAFRDSTLFKTSYLFGLRRNEVRNLQTVDFTRNPRAGEFGRFGHLNVRFGKASKGSAYKQRNVLAVHRWGTSVLEDWLERGQPPFGATRDLFPTERGTVVSESALNARFRTYRDDIGVGDDVTFHSFRRSYITHLIEDGWDALFVQQQVGHEYASTTALYTAVSSDYRTRTLRRVLDATAAQLTRHEQEHDAPHD